jgi:hypothetical protein
MIQVLERTSVPSTPTGKDEGQNGLLNEAPTKALVLNFLSYNKVCVQQ